DPDRVEVRGSESRVECDGVVERRQCLTARDALPVPKVRSRVSQLEPHLGIVRVALGRSGESGEQSVALCPPRRVVGEATERLEQRVGDNQQAVARSQALVEGRDAKLISCGRGHDSSLVQHYTL